MALFTKNTALWITTICTFVLAIPVGVRFCSSLSQKLTATVEYGAIPLSPEVKQLVEAAQLLQRENWFDELSTGEDEGKSRRPETLSREQTYHLANHVRSTIERMLPIELLLATAGPVGYYGIEVRNDGSQALRAVRLLVADAYSMEIKRESQQAPVLEKGSVLSIDSLQPQEAVHVLAYSKLPATKYNAEGIRLTHADGVGAVYIRAPVGRFGQFAENMAGVWLIILLGIFFILILLISSFTSKGPTAGAPSNSESR